MKILIIRFSSIGDIVLTTPVIRCLKKQLSGCEIHYLTKYSYKDLIEFNPYIDKRHFLKDDLDAVTDELKKEKFDLVVDLHHNLRSVRVKWALRTKHISFNKINFEKWIYVWLKWNIMPMAHIVDRYMATVRSLGVVNDGEGLDFFLSPADQIKLEDLPLTHLHGFIAVAIGGNHETKKLPVEKLMRLVKQLSVPVILLGGKEDESAGEEIKMIDSIKVYNGCGKFSIQQSASVIRLAKALITHDTGLMHIGAALGKRIVSVWGNTVPQFGMYPYYGKHQSGWQHQSLSHYAEVKNLWCRPCSKLGYRKCPLGHFKCMNKQDENSIAMLAEGN